MRNGLRPLLIGAAVALLAAAGVGGVVFAVSRPAVAGGKVLTYEVKGEALSADQARELADQLKRRIDPDDRNGVIVRPAGPNRVGILVPFLGHGDGEYLDDVRQMVRQTGLLEFRILANPEDDREAITATRNLLDTPTEQDREDLRRAAEQGLPPLVTAAEYRVKAAGEEELVSYRWVELGPEERDSLGLSEQYEAVGKRINGGFNNRLFDEVAKTRGKVYPPADVRSTFSPILYSRATEYGPDVKTGKRVDYFALARESPKDSLAVTGDVNLRATVAVDAVNGPAVDFEFVSGAERFAELTRRNRASGDFRRTLAVILDGRVVTAPQLNEPLSGRGRISGNFDMRSARRLAAILNTGVLPVELKPDPVLETPLSPADEAAVRGATSGHAARAGSIWAAATFAVVLCAWVVVCLQLGRRSRTGR